MLLQIEVTAPPAAASRPARFNLVNYFPTSRAQGLFWSSWDPATINTDFATLDGTLHANAVRVFVPTQQFGWPAPLRPAYTSELADLLKIAARHHLRVYLDLFNYYVPYSDIANSQRWAADLLRPFRGDSRLAAIEVQNEIDPFDGAAITWAKAMIPYIKRIDGGIPVSISVCGCDSAGDLATLHTSLAASQPDFYDFHYYADTHADPSPAQAENTSEAAIEAVLAQARGIVSPLPLIVGETGVSTFYPDAPDNPEASSDPRWEAAQRDFFDKVETASAAAGIPPAAPWGYIDVRYNGGVRDTSQRFFGIFRSNGSPKPAASVVANAFGGPAH